MKLIFHVELDEKDLIFCSKDKLASKNALKRELESTMDLWLMTLESGSKCYKFIEDERDKYREQ